MTLEELCENHTVEQLKAMTDEALLKHFEPYFAVTRPEIAQRAQPKETQTTMNQVYMSPQKKQAMATLASLGVDMGFLKARKKK